MNNPDDMPIDIQEMIEWLLQHKAKSGLSWDSLGKVSGIPGPTLSMVTSGKYAGNIEAQAKRIFQFRQTVQSKAEQRRWALAGPDYIRTPSSRRIETLLEIAHTGRITVAAMGPGTGKTKTAEHYQASMSHVWLSTMLETTKTVTGMIAQVIGALGLATKSGSWSQVRSASIREFMAGRGGLLIIDEAQHLTREALEELRGWHDLTQVGLTLLGNEELMGRFTGPADRHAYARLRSRIANYHIQDLPTEADVRVYLDALDLIEPDLRKPLMEIGLSPLHGGLREVQQVIDQANMLALGDDQPLAATHVHEAIASRATVITRRAA